MPAYENPYARIHDRDLSSEAFARSEDARDALSKLRAEFVIPTKADLRNKRYGPSDAPAGPHDDDESIYLCGNSLGLQPRRTREYVNRYLDTWASKGVFGHFKTLEGGHPPWLHLDDALKNQTAQIVGALATEVVVMETLTANLHLLMSSFYKPTPDRYKIIIEGKAFPSDHVSSHFRTACLSSSSHSISTLHSRSLNTTTSPLLPSSPSLRPRPTRPTSQLNTSSPSSPNTTPRLPLCSSRESNSTRASSLTSNSSHDTAMVWA